MHTSTENTSNYNWPNIGFDAKRYFNNQTGLGNYARWLINGLAEDEQMKLHLYHTKRVKTSDRFVVHSPKYAFKPAAAVWRSKGITKDLVNQSVKLYHGLSNEIPLGLKKAGIKSVVTIHDLINMRFPENYNSIDLRIYEQKLQHAIENADAIVTPSIQTKVDILSYFDTDSDKISVIPLSISPPLKAKKKANVSPYVLCVSGFSKRKNLENLVEAYGGLDSNVKLIIAGREGDSFKKVDRLAKNFTNIVLELNPSNEQLAELYTNALCCVYPSVFEGFGIPILEAMSYGKAVATSNVSSMPEVGGKAAIYFDPNDIADIQKSIQDILKPETRMHLESAIDEQIAKFDSATLLDRYKSLYQNVLNS